MTGPNLSPRQTEAIRGATGRVNLYHGAIRSGKTIASLIRWLLFVASMLTASGELVIVGRTRDSAWRNVISPLQDPALFGPIAAEIKGNYGAPTVSILGRRVYVLGASDVQAEKVIRGLTVLGAYVDEVTTIPEGFFTQLLGRMSPPGAKLFGTTNPDGPMHWLKKLIDKGIDRWRVFHFTLDDNPSLDPNYVASIKAEFVGLWYRRFILGEWVQAEGAIYDMWDPARHVIAHDQLPALDLVLALGIDYGTTNDTAGILLGLNVEQRRLYAVDEWAPRIAAGRSLTDAEQSQHLRRWLTTREPEGWREPRWIPVDPAAASFKQQLFLDGVRGVTNAHNDVLRGIRTIASLLATNRLQVSDRCTQLITEIPGYAWDPKATARGEDKPLKVNDHFDDALRYAAHTTASQWRPHIPILTADVDEEAA